LRGRSRLVQAFAVESELGDLRVQRRGHHRADVHGRIGDHQGVPLQQDAALTLLVDLTDDRVQFLADAAEGLLLGGLQLTFAQLRLALIGIGADLKGGGARFNVQRRTGGKEQSFDGAGPTINIPGKALEEGTYTYWVDRDGVKDPKVSTLVIDFDNTAPQVYIEKPSNNAVWTPEILVRGAVLPGWNASVDGISIPIDKQRRFSAKVGKPGAGALAIKLAHPQFGVHYYLRRGK